jgi:Xaa-Pro aminopeptidase
VSPSKRWLLFSKEEYQTRLTTAKSRMLERGVDVLIVTEPSNINYLCGYDAWSFYVTQCLLVSTDSDQPIWIGRKMDVSGAKLTSFLDDEHIIGYGDDYVQAANRNPMTFIAEIMASRNWQKKRVGIEMDAYFTTPKNYQSLVASLPDTTLVDASLLVNWLRTIKSPAELELMNQAGKLAELSMQAAYDTMNVGVRGCDVAANIYQAQIKGTPEFGGSYLTSIAYLPTDERSATPHLTWTDEPYKDGQITPIELTGCRKRYTVALSRTMYLGKPPKNISDLAEVVIEGMTAALESVKPGVTCEEVEAVWRKTVSKHGLTKESRLGYSIGLSYPPTTGDRTMSLRSGDTTVLQPNMTFHLIPGIWNDDWGLVISESFCVTETGHRLFCDFPRQLLVKA